MSDFERFFAKHPTSVQVWVFGEFVFINNVHKNFRERLAKMLKNF